MRGVISFLAGVSVGAVLIPSGIAEDRPAGALNRVDIVVEITELGTEALPRRAMEVWETSP
jgi:hypothetical protein